MRIRWSCARRALWLIAALVSARTSAASPPSSPPPPASASTPPSAAETAPAVAPPSPESTTEPPAPGPTTDEAARELAKAPDSDEPRFAPPPNLERNPIDVLPPDVVSLPLRQRPVRPVLWNPEWPRFGTADWAITGAGIAIALGAAILPPRQEHLYGGVLIDEEARKVLRMPTSEGRYVARDASDIILALEATWPFFVDALITTWWFRGSPDAAAQMVLVDAKALAIVTAVQGVTNTLVSRERPYGRICGTDEQPASTIDCEGNVRYRSFFSGHSAFVFTSAGLICVHHQKLDLLRGAGDEIACATAYAGAAATATLRVMGDMHYVSVVLVGAGVGTLVGLAVPLLHYRRVNLTPKDKAVFDWMVVPHGAGLGVGGTF